MCKKPHTVQTTGQWCIAVNKAWTKHFAVCKDEQCPLFWCKTKGFYRNWENRDE